MEVYQTTRPVKKLTAGKMLRVMDPSPFRLAYTLDDWATNSTVEAQVVGYPGSYADILTTPEQRGRIVFTLYWPGENRWLGQNIEVELVQP
jgi:glucoamylase